MGPVEAALAATPQLPPISSFFLVPIMPSHRWPCLPFFFGPCCFLLRFCLQKQLLVTNITPSLQPFARTEEDQPSSKAGLLRGCPAGRANGVERGGGELAKLPRQGCKSVVGETAVGESGELTRLSRQGGQLVVGEVAVGESGGLAKAPPAKRSHLPCSRWSRRWSVKEVFGEGREGPGFALPPPPPLPLHSC